MNNIIITCEEAIEIAKKHFAGEEVQEDLLAKAIAHAITCEKCNNISDSTKENNPKQGDGSKEQTPETD